jgi:hypothetical protein
MEESMIEIDESTYEQLSDRSRSLEDKMNLVRCCCKLDPSYGRMKEKILEDLFFQTLNFCVEGGFSSSSWKGSCSILSGPQELGVDLPRTER